MDDHVLNLQAEEDKQSLPSINDVLDQLEGVKLLSDLDRQQAHKQVRLKEGEIPKTAFSTHFDLMVLGISFGLMQETDGWEVAGGLYARVWNLSLAALPRPTVPSCYSSTAFRSGPRES